MKPLLSDKKILFSLLVFFILIVASVITYKYYFGSFSSLSPKSAKIYKLKILYYDEFGHPYDGLSALHLEEASVSDVFKGCSPNFHFKDPLLSKAKLKWGTGNKSILSDFLANLPEKTGFNACSPYVIAEVVRDIPVLSLYVQKGEDIIEWFDSNPQAQELRRSDLYKQIIDNFSNNLKTKDKTGLSSKLFSSFLGQLIESNGSLHIDTRRGVNGFSFVFKENKAKIASNSLLILIKEKSKRGYQIAGLENLIWEIQAGDFNLFITKNENKIYLSSSLSSIINTMDIPDIILSNSLKVGGSLALTLRVNELLSEHGLNKINIENALTANFGVELNKKTTKSTRAVFDEAKEYKWLSPHISEGVLHAIPSSVSAAMVASLAVPDPVDMQKMQTSDGAWSLDFLVKQTQDSGIAVVLDFDKNSTNKTLDIGIVVQKNHSDEVEGYSLSEASNRHPDVFYFCERGQSFIYASSENLFKKMQDSCEARRPSVLNWNIPQTVKFVNAQTFFMINLMSILEYNAYKYAEKNELKLTKNSSSFPILAYYGNIVDNGSLDLIGVSVF